MSVGTQAGVQMAVAEEGLVSHLPCEGLGSS